MATILEFRAAAGQALQAAQPQPRSQPGTPAEIVIFPGVRIERHVEREMPDDQLDKFQQ